MRPRLSTQEGLRSARLRSPSSNKLKESANKCLPFSQIIGNEDTAFLSEREKIASFLGACLIERPQSLVERAKLQSLIDSIKLQNLCLDSRSCRCSWLQNSPLKSTISSRK